MEKLVTPVDELTGLPLPILPDLEPQTGALFFIENYHHHFHPRRSPSLQDAEGKAVRFSRGQLLPKYQHDRYHEIFEGPQLPKTSDEKFKIAVLACAGIVPKQGIRIHGKNDYEISIASNQEYEYLIDRKRIYAEKEFSLSGKGFHIRQKTIGEFFAKYALSQELSYVSDSVADEFLHTTKKQRIKELGNWIFTEAVREAVRPLAPLHRAVRIEKLCQQRRGKNPHQVVNQFLSPAIIHESYGSLRERLAS